MYCRPATWGSQAARQLERPHATSWKESWRLLSLSSAIGKERAPSMPLARELWSKLFVVSANICIYCCILKKSVSLLKYTLVVVCRALLEMLCLLPYFYSCYACKSVSIFSCCQQVTILLISISSKIVIDCYLHDPINDNFARTIAILAIIALNSESIVDVNKYVQMLWGEIHPLVMQSTLRYSER